MSQTSHTGDTHDLISPADLNAREEASAAEGATPLVIDVRGPKEYAAGHVRGALHIPASQIAKKLARIPRDRLVVTYCNMHHPGESRGERAAAILREYGYDARALNGGYSAWKDAGLRVGEASAAG